MKLLHVITSLRTGGAEKLMVDLLPRLRDMGNEVELLVFDGTRTAFFDQLETAGIKVNFLQVGGSVYNPLNILRLRKFLKCFDVVHTHNTACQLFATLANIGVGTKLVTTEHNTSNRRRGNAIFHLLDRWMYRRYKKIVCISQKAEDILREWLGGEWGSILTINNGIDVKKIENAEPAELDFVKDRESIHVSVMVAAFRWEKDQQTVIRAYKELPENFHLALVGGGNESLKQKCIQLAAECGVAERIHFLGLRSDVPSILKAADAVIQSSHIDGFCLAAVEGMAAGKPVIASDVVGLADVVRGYGELFPHEDSKALAGVIKKLADNPEYAANVAATCQKRTAQFDISVMAEKYNQVYLGIK
ncbi:MAG: glycosyltransferase [Bacteroidales bacterium]|nr:glycosyltransferase [Bacteroidales bacterium]